MGRRYLAWGLILYGIAGLGLVIGGAIVGLDVAARVERLADDADGTLAAAASATRAAADAFDDVDASLADGEASARSAAVLASDAAGTLRSLATTMELSVFGTQPLLPLAGDFRTSADQAEALAGTLESVGTSLGTTRTGVADVGPDLGMLADRLEALDGPGPGGAEPPPIRLFVVLLLAWLLMPALAALAAGIGLFRRTARRLRG